MIFILFGEAIRVAVTWWKTIYFSVWCLCNTDTLLIWYDFFVPDLSPWISPQDQTAADPCRPTSEGSREKWRCISWYKEPINRWFRVTIMMCYRDRKTEWKLPFIKQLYSHSGGQRSDKMVLLHRVVQIFLQSIDLWLSTDWLVDMHFSK